MTIFRGVGAVLLALLLMSCSNDDPGSDPSDPSSQTTTPSTSPSPTGPVEPEPPEPASKPTKASAIAFVKYYWQVADYAQATAESDLLRSLASKRCAFCDGGADYVDGVRAKGGVVIRSKPYGVNVARVQLGTVRGGTVDIALVTCRLSIPKSVEFYGKGDARNKHFPGGRGTYMLDLEWVPGLASWQLQEVEEA